MSDDLPRRRERRHPVFQTPWQTQVGIEVVQVPPPRPTPLDGGKPCQRSAQEEPTGTGDPVPSKKKFGRRPPEFLWPSRAFYLPPEDW